MSAIDIKQTDQTALSLERMIVNYLQWILNKIGVTDEALQFKLIFKGRLSLMENTPVYAWCEIDPTKILPLSGLRPVKRDDFPEEIWNFVTPSDHSLLWIAKKVYHAGQEFNKPSEDRELGKLIDYRLAWIIFSFMRYWFTEGTVGLAFIMPQFKQHGLSLQWLIENGFDDEKILSFFKYTSDVKLDTSMITKFRMILKNAKTVIDDDGDKLKDKRKKLTREIARNLIKKHDGNITSAAKEYGCSREYMSKKYNSKDDKKSVN